MSRPVILIAGPTAGGKSALALDLARREGGEIVNADALQVYRDLRILTARPDAAIEALAPHHLFGSVDGDAPWSVGAWVRAADRIIGEIRGRGALPIIVGGTGLYFKALIEGLADVPPTPAGVREEMARRYERQGEASFREDLRQYDPKAEARITPADRQRLTRAMEVFVATGRALSDWQADTRPLLAPGTWRALVVEPDRETLFWRCDERLIAMLREGALAEVEQLRRRGLSPNRPVMKALGVAPLIAHLAGEITLAEALSLAQRDTRRFAKRQLTWFRNQTPDWPRWRGEGPAPL